MHSGVRLLGFKSQIVCDLVWKKNASANSVSLLVWFKGGRWGVFPLWLSGLRTLLVSMRMWVQTLASLSGLRIWPCHVLQRLRSQMGLVVWLWLWCRLAVEAPILSPLGETRMPQVWP